MLQGIELIDCAKANASQGISFAAKQSGYQDDIKLFEQKLYEACEQIGVNIDSIQDLITDRQKIIQNTNVREISPDSASNL